MRLPKQPKPVARGVSSSPTKAGVAPSQANLCELCLAACNQLGFMKPLCVEACHAKFC